MMIHIEKDKNERLMFMIKHDQLGSTALEVRPRFMRRLTDELTAYLFASDSTPVANDRAVKSAVDMLQSAKSF